METYKEIIGTNYEISILGNIRNKKTQRLLKPWKRGEYLAVNLGANNPFYIHKLMAKIYLEEKEGLVVDHINRNKFDNSLSNLRIISQYENQLNCGERKNNKLGHKNICKVSMNSYNVRIVRKGKLIFCRNFNSLEKAIEARENFLSSY